MSALATEKQPLSARWREPASIAVILLAVAVAFMTTGVLQRWDNLMYDAMLKLRAHAAPPAAAIIVAIDDQSLEEIGRWPWPRHIHALLIDRLRQAGARVVGFDILFSEPEDEHPGDDRVLAQALRAHGKVVLPVAPAGHGDDGIHVALPIPELAQSAMLGHVDVELDDDGIVRGSYLRAGIGAPHFPSLALAMLLAGDPDRATGLVGDRDPVPPVPDSRLWVRSDRFLVPFVGAPGTIERVPYAEVLRGKTDALAKLRDRYVLVGATAAGIGSSLATPVSRLGQPMSGVEFNANVFSSLHDGLLPRLLPRSAGLALTALLVMLSLVLYALLPPQAALVAVAVPAAVAVGTSLALVRLGPYWFGPAPALVTLIIGYPLWSWRRLRASVAALRAERNRIEATLHAIGDAVITTDREGRVQYLNPVAEFLTGRNLDSARGCPLDEVVRSFGEGEDRQMPLPWRECLSSGRTVHSSRHRVLRAGDAAEHAIRWSGSPIRDASGNISGMVLAFSDVTEMLALSREVVWQATHDTLTGLPNRSHLEAALEQAIARARRVNQPVAVMFIDLDGFKKVNDAFGHAAGDALLRDVAQRLRSRSREHDLISRWGGDEFVMVLENLQTRDAATAAGSKVLEAMAEPFQTQGHEVFISASIGISQFPRDGDDPGLLLKRADAAMYRVKEHGRNALQFYSQDMNDRARERLATEKALWHALRTEALELYYQPQIELPGRRIIGVEALVRWNDPDRGLIPPGRFIPVAEQSDLIHGIGAWVLRTACDQLAQWRRAGLRDIHMAVNLSPRQLLKRDLYNTVSEIVGESGIDPSALILEISENLLVMDAATVANGLRRLRDVGIRLSMDDFGTGHSSIGYLRRLPIDEVKIDKSFVRNLPAKADDAAIVTGMVALAHGLRLRVVAEGVETEDQLRFFEGLGCEAIQGFYFSRPLPAAAMTDLLRGLDKAPGDNVVRLPR